MTVKRALFFSTADRYLQLTMTFTSTAVLSRLLSPEEIGVSVVGLAIVGLALSIRDFASTTYIIQHPKLTKAVIRGSFSVLLAITLVLCAVLAFGARPIARLYDDVKLVPYLRVVSVAMICDLVAIQTTALMRRDLTFGGVAIINASGAVATTLTAIVLALAGFSYMSFAWGWLASSIVTAIISLVLRPAFDQFVPTLSHWRGMLSFGGYNGTITFLYKIYDTMPALLLGRMVGADAVGMFNRATTVCQIPDKLIVGGASTVILSAFAAHAREGRELRKPYLHALQIITALQWPALVVLVLLADPLVRLILGQQWDAAVPLVQVLSLAMLFSFSFDVNFPLLVSLGAIRTMLVRSLIVFPAGALAMGFGIWADGLSGAAWSMLFIVPFNAVVSLTFVKARLELPWREIAATLAGSAVVALASALGPALVLASAGFTFEISLLEAFAAALLAAIGWLAGMVAVRHPLLAEIDLMLVSIAARVPRLAASIAGLRRQLQRVATAAGMGRSAAAQ